MMMAIRTGSAEAEATQKQAQNAIMDRNVKDGVNLAVTAVTRRWIAGSGDP